MMSVGDDAACSMQYWLSRREVHGRGQLGQYVKPARETLQLSLIFYTHKCFLSSF